MTALHELYQELILDHNRKPRNQRRIEDADRRAQGYNPLCGDRVTVYLTVADDVVIDVAFEGSGCAISTASASLMTQAVKGKSIEDARALFARFREMLVSESATHDDLGKLEALRGVKRFPARVKCATLAWHTLNAALEQSGASVTTE